MIATFASACLTLIDGGWICLQAPSQGIDDTTPGPRVVMISCIQPEELARQFHVPTCAKLITP